MHSNLTSKTRPKHQVSRHRVKVAAVPDGKSSRQSWDFSRFVKTVLFFNPPPSLDSIVQGLMGNRDGQRDGKRSAMALPKSSNILLLGDGSSSFGEQSWGPLDDVVMGGTSLSSIESVKGEGEGGGFASVFSGVVSTSNSGGFASVRSKNFEPPLNLMSFKGIELRVKGDGQRYKIILRTEAGWDTTCYCWSFDTKKEQWQTIRIPFTSFFPVFRAKTMRGGAAMDASSLYSVQLMLSKFEYDGELNPFFAPGPFALPISKISVF